MNVIDKLLEGIKRYAAQDKEILCVYLFGSVAREEKSLTSDVDVCLVLNKGNYSSLELSRK
ncbi:MAG: nucleotidyltransferase domain-containing protein [Spirochaetota bacterium]|nr:MAG: nucleotidyltransferase domain-containing protein [Spirochaetota bacterium]